MLKKREAFLKILCIELEDLDDDIQVLITECEKKYCNEEISNYVFLENLALLRNELFGVESFIDDVKSTTPTDFETIDNLIQGLMEKLESRIQEKGIAHSIVSFIDRKMNKVKRYIDK